MPTACPLCGLRSRAGDLCPGCLSDLVPGVPGAGRCLHCAVALDSAEPGGRQRSTRCDACAVTHARDRGYDRTIAVIDYAYPGDVIGVINPGLFAIGDTISVTGGFNFKPLPQFQPEIFSKLYPKDVGKRKSFDKGVLQLTDEGAIQLLHAYEREGDLIFAAVGKLQPTSPVTHLTLPLVTRQGTTLPTGPSRTYY